MHPTSNPIIAVIIEVRGGTVQAVRSNHPDHLGVTLVDWDNIQAGDRPIEYGVEPLNNSDPMLLLGVEGDETHMQEWFAAHDRPLPSSDRCS